MPRKPAWTRSGRHSCGASTSNTPSGCSSRPWAGPARRSAAPKPPTAGPGWSSWPSPSSGSPAHWRPTCTDRGRSQVPRTDLPLPECAAIFGTSDRRPRTRPEHISKSAADRIIDQLGPLIAFQPRRRFAKDTVLVVDGTLVPTRNHSIAEQPKNYRYSTNHQVVIDADTRLVVVVGKPLPGNRNDYRAWEESGAKAAVGRTLTMADGGYPGTGLLMPHRRTPGEELPGWKREHNRSHKQVRARVEHVFARMKTWKILRDCHLKGDGVRHAMLGIARLHNLALTG
ncbi:transposase [Streptomyces sp. NBC_00234]|nr:transposase [Streptomyces sp. NBC_00234]